MLLKMDRNVLDMNCVGSTKKTRSDLSEHMSARSFVNE